MVQWINVHWNNSFINLMWLPLLYKYSGAIHLEQPGLTVASHGHSFFSVGRYRLQYKHPAYKRVWSGFYRQIALMPPCQPEVLICSVVLRYKCFNLQIHPGLKHDLNKSTPPVGTEVSEQLAYANQTRPFLG